MTSLEKEIREIAQQVLMMQKIAQVFAAKNDTNKLNDIIFKIKTEADTIYDLSVSGQKDGLVVYVNATSFIVRTFSDIGNPKEALAYGAEALRKSMAILVNLERNNPYSLPEEMKSSFKIVQLNQLITIIVSDLLGTQSNKDVLYGDSSLLTDMFTLFLLGFDELKLVAPENLFIKNTIGNYNALSSNDLGVSTYSSADAVNFLSFAETLEHKIRKFPLYNDELDAEVSMNKYDGIYYDEWFDSVYNDTRSCSTDKLDSILGQYKKQIVLFGNTDLHKCNFYHTDSEFNWIDQPEALFDLYMAICSDYEITPMKFNEYFPLEKVPYVSPKNLEKMHRDVVKTYLQLREYNVCGCGKLPLKPSDDEILNFVENEVSDENVIMYFIGFLEFIFELEGTLIKIKELELLYDRLTILFLEGNGSIDGDSKDEIEAMLMEELGEYEKMLRTAGIIPASWQYDIDEVIKTIPSYICIRKLL